MSDIEALAAQLRSLDEWVGRHDLRTATIVAMAFAVMGLGHSPFVEVPSFIIGGARWFLFTELFLSASLFAAAVSLFPVIDKRGRSLVFFGGIAQLSLAEYEAKMESLSETEAAAEYRKAIHASAIILARKYRLLRWSMGLFVVGIGVLPPLVLSEFVLRAFGVGGG